jgi:hypothetical protein
MSDQVLARDSGDSSSRFLSTGLRPDDSLEKLIDVFAERLFSRVAADQAGKLPIATPDAESWSLLDVHEVAARVGRSTRWVRERAKSGQLPFIRLDGGALAFELEDVKALARARRISASEPTALAARSHDMRNAPPPATSSRRERATDPDGA